MQRKPAADGLIYAANAVGIDLKQLLFVGDHQNDAFAAASAGVDIAIVSWCAGTEYAENIKT